MSATDSTSCGFDPIDQSLPPKHREKFAWHLDDEFSQLRTARTEAAQHASATRIRIAHLDTGHDPAHDTFPASRITDEIDFVDFDNNATDPGNSGMLKHPGHGAGTLSILSGGRFFIENGPYRFDEELGGAPNAMIIPIRVGNSVVQLKTSSVASGIKHAVDVGAHVLSMSMGGVASHAWADAVNLAYESGLVLVTAAGNNVSAGAFGLPTRYTVYPARFRRVLAACGVMADGTPYYGLRIGKLQGNWGPRSKANTSLSAYTPNAPWAQHGCPKVVDMDGQGTSCATPQIAAAAALYFQMHGDTLFDSSRYPEKWMQAEAVRRALLDSAAAPDNPRDLKKLGRGLLRASDALKIAPLERRALRREKKDRAGLAFWRTITGLGVASDPLSEQMLALEAAQLSQRWDGQTENPYEALDIDPDVGRDETPERQVTEYLDRLRSHPSASKALRKRINLELDGTAKRPGGSGVGPETGVGVGSGLPIPEQPSPPVKIPEPRSRRLQCFAVDPLLATNLDSALVSRITLEVPWEPLEPGPVGEYLEVIDVDPAGDPTRCYEPVDLERPELLAQDGLPPSEGSPQFHQQMVYAVCSLTIKHFESALGRRAQWRARPNSAKPGDLGFIPKLRIYPHALREANAYYATRQMALMFGYFNARNNDPSELLPGGRVFTCLSHDIIAHETAHALLDGLHKEFLKPTNPDVHAFHEAFADIVSLFQRLTFPELLRHEIAKTRGNIRDQPSLLGSLAIQFGPAQRAGTRGALREAIGRFDSDDNWIRNRPDPTALGRTKSPHSRGAILVAAVFDAFISIFERRTADLVRLASGGTGILPDGAIHPDLVERLAREATCAAKHVLTMCIRALDYCPPTDITFGEYLRALITADYELVRDDDLHYRTAFIEAFRRRGIYPRDVRTLSIESLLWHRPMPGALRASGLADHSGELLRTAHRFDSLRTRKDVFIAEHEMCKALETWLREYAVPRTSDATEIMALRDLLGIDPHGPFSIRGARFTNRVGPDGNVQREMIVSILQEREMHLRGTSTKFYGGCTLVLDLSGGAIKYCVRKNARSGSRESRQRAFMLSDEESLRRVYFSEEDDTNSEPFALLHKGF
ncbi:MAG: S8 family serine peptidase [Planctomycetota bacterium]